MYVSLHLNERTKTPIAFFFLGGGVHMWMNFIRCKVAWFKINARMVQECVFQMSVQWRCHGSDNAVYNFVRKPPILWSVRGKHPLVFWWMYGNPKHVIQYGQVTFNHRKFWALIFATGWIKERRVIRFPGLVTFRIKSPYSFDNTFMIWHKIG